MMTQSGWVSALRAHLSQWNWLGTAGQQSSCTGHVLISHTERGSGVVFPNLTRGQTRACCLGGADGDTGEVKGSN